MPYKRTRGNGFTPRKRVYARRRKVTYTRPSNLRTGGFIDLENKFSDTFVSGDAFSTSWATMNPTTVNCLSAVAQGDSESERDGRVYHIRSLHIKGSIKSILQESSASPLSDIRARVVIVWDKQTNAATVTAANVMDESAPQDITSFKNLQFSKRFQILFDKTMILKRGMANMNEGAINLFAAPAVEKQFFFTKYWRKPIKVVCVSTEKTVGSISDNSFAVIGVADSSQVVLNLNCRVRFSG